MDFAKKQLLKYGWKEGEGIGKEGNQGIANALKPKYKHGKEGMGYDLSKDLVDTWWTRSYSDSLARININSSKGSDHGTSVDEDDDEGVRVSFLQDESGGDEMSKMRRRMVKTNFLEFSKGATLNNGEMIDEENSDSDDSGIATPSSSKTLSDEELFKACGGRTAHKAARFGHKLSGKLARIAAQEEAELLAYQARSLQQQQESTSVKVKPKKSKRKHVEEIGVEVAKIEKKRKKKSASEAMAIEFEEVETEVTTHSEEIEDMDHEPVYVDEKEGRRKRKHK